MKALQAEKEKANTKQKGNEKENKNAKGNYLKFQVKNFMKIFFQSQMWRIKQNWVHLPLKSSNVCLIKIPMINWLTTSNISMILLMGKSTIF